MVPYWFPLKLTPKLKKALKLRPKWKEYLTLSTSTSRQTLHAKIRSKYIDRAATLFGDSKTENTATLLMYLLPIFAWRVCLDVEVDSQDSVGYPLHFGLNLRAFFELGVDIRENQWHHRVSRELLHKNQQSYRKFLTHATFSLYLFLSEGSALLFLTLLKVSWRPSLPSLDTHIALPELNNLTEGPSEIWEKIGLKDLLFHIILSETVAFSFYLIFGGFLHYHYYVKQREKAEEWKCQPKKFLPTNLEIDELRVGCKALFYCNIVSGLISCYIYNGGSLCSIYYDLGDYPFWWTVLQYAVTFLYQDYVTYWLHRFYHTPFFYKNFHKIHHRYKQPTAFSVTAMHPVELIHIQLFLAVPAFSIPVHYSCFLFLTAYTYYHGVVQHSGVTFKSHWWQPWQPDCMFHDNHHQYFHVNFGFNCWFWDVLHGTFRKKDRIYTEDIYGGKGKPLAAANPSEIANEIEERQCENPLAYRSNKPDYELLDEDIKDVSTEATVSKRHSTKLEVQND